MAGATPGAGRTGVKRSLPICRLLKQGRRLGSLRLLHGFGLGLLNGLLRGLRFLLGGELLLDLEGDGVGVHLIDSGGIMKHLRGIVPGGHVKDGGFHQHFAQHALFGTAQVRGKQLPE